MRILPLAASLLLAWHAPAADPCEANLEGTSGTLVLTEEMRFSSIAAEDGFVTESAEGSRTRGQANMRDAQGIVGDDAANRARIAFLSFDLASIPEGSTITGARLRLTRGNSWGNPKLLGPLLVDVMGSGGVEVPELDVAQLNDPDGSKSAAGVLEIPSERGASMEATIDAKLLDPRRAPRVGVRLAFRDASNGNKAQDALSLHMAEASPAQRPELIVSLVRTVPVAAPPPAAKGDSELVLYSIAGDDGEVIESAKSSGVGGSAQRGSPTMFIGDGSRGQQSKALLSFDTSAIPAGAEVTGATLRLFGTRVAGRPGSLGPLFASMRVGDAGGALFGTDPAVESSDFQVQPHLHRVAEFRAAAANADVAAELHPLAAAMLSRTGPTQFIVRFCKATNGDASADGVTVASGDYGSDSPARPRLVVRYRPAVRD